MTPVSTVWTAPRTRLRPGIPALGLACALVALLLTGCAARAGKFSRPAGSAEADGVVLAARRVPARQTSAARAVLAALNPGGIAAAGLPAHRGPAHRGVAEVLIRIDDGHVVSVLTPADARFRAGERVWLLPGPAPRLVRLGRRT